ncbi:hypothetical protein NKH54_27480 [Mesorhizobium sp. M1004]|uniref:hypothetical protein n=1 Tax=Mesorhizobium sp. M1004 TaxID=2957046 RepID=UPI003334CF9C
MIQPAKRTKKDGIEIFIGSQEDPALIDQIVDKYHAFDIVIAMEVTLCDTQ